MSWSRNLILTAVLQNMSTSTVLLSIRIYSNDLDDHTANIYLLVGETISPHVERGSVMQCNSDPPTWGLLFRPHEHECYPLIYFTLGPSLVGDNVKGKHLHVWVLVNVGGRQSTEQAGCVSVHQLPLETSENVQFL